MQALSSQRSASKIADFVTACRARMQQLQVANQSNIWKAQGHGVDHAPFVLRAPGHGEGGLGGLGGGIMMGNLLRCWKAGR